MFRWTARFLLLVMFAPVFGPLAQARTSAPTMHCMRSRQGNTRRTPRCSVVDGDGHAFQTGIVRSFVSSCRQLLPRSQLLPVRQYLRMGSASFWSARGFESPDRAGTPRAKRCASIERYFPQRFRPRSPRFASPNPRNGGPLFRGVARIRPLKGPRSPIFGGIAEATRYEHRGLMGKRDYSALGRRAESRSRSVTGD